MANALEDNINQLEDEIQAREDFVAAFAHERQKTPAASIIGYADALRSRRLDEENSLCPPTIFTRKGKRLEAMSFPPVGHHGRFQEERWNLPWCRAESPVSVPV